MEIPIILRFARLSHSSHLWSEHTMPQVVEQLRTLGRDRPDSQRYAVGVEIHQGHRAPASDIDNYAKCLIDAVTQSRCLWPDDFQIDELHIKRVFVRERQDTDVVLTIIPVEKATA